jgi:hypothetical protein
MRKKLLSTKRWVFQRLLALMFLLGGFAGLLSAQIAQRGTATTATSTTTSVTVSKPTGLTIGDLMLATINQSTNNNNVSLSDAVSTGWQLLAGQRFYENGNDEWWATVLYKVANATDVAAADFLFSGDSDADDIQASIVAFSDV